MHEPIQNGTYAIRPAGRHILTIGANLIKDKYAAVVELVKNAYDADADKVVVSFSKKPGDEGGIIVEVSDTGDGMSFDTVTNQWMVPSTRFKVDEPVSRLGRVRQGSKGVGRYAASILGKELFLETVTASGELTTLYLRWDDFEKAEYLEQVLILVESVRTSRSQGTTISMEGADPWTDKEMASLRFELRKLLAPTPDEEAPDAGKAGSGEADEAGGAKGKERDFTIELRFDESWTGLDTAVIESIEPFPIIRFYDYRIWGHVNADGYATLRFHNNRNDDSEVLEVSREIHLPENKKYDLSYCGPLDVDFRVYDREPDAIQNLIDRGLREPGSKESIGKRQAKAILNEYNGIGVYRNGFRIRPLGDPGFDWILLDKMRVQNPTLRIGSDQVIGFIQVASESESDLQEKSARDGLRENAAYFGLIEISRQILSILEARRFEYRVTAGLSRKQRDTSSQLDELFRLEDLKRRVEKTLDSGKVSEDVKTKIIALIDTQQEANTRNADALKRIVAIYQGQATVGKIVHILLHEGRKPLGYFLNSSKYIAKAAKQLAAGFTAEKLNKIVEKADGFEQQAKIMAGLFGKLDPLAARRGERQSEFVLKKIILEVLAVFETELAQYKINVSVSCAEEITFFGWAADFHAAFTNLVENSIHWLKTVKTTRSISFIVDKRPDTLQIEYRDNGPGIQEDFIKSQVIFEPGFTTKTDSGSGLGLAIAGEAVSRNGGRLSAEHPEDEAGVRFVMLFQIK